MANRKMTAVIEGALFISGDPLPLTKIARLCNFSEDEARKNIKILQERYNEQGSGLLLMELPEGYLLGTKPQLAVYLDKLYEEEISPVLSQAALETLAIIAYKQPITRPEIEEIRGVSVDGVLEKLTKRKLIKVAGKKDAPGRPLLYVTTNNFLSYFGMQSLEELPTLEESK